APAGAGPQASGREPDGLRGDGPVRPRTGGAALPANARPAVRADAFLRAAGELGPRVGAACAWPFRGPVGYGDGKGLRDGCGGCGEPDPGPPALAYPRM